MTDVRWVQFPGRSHVLHLINEETSGWAQTEIFGSLIAYCGRISSETHLVDPPSATNHCKMCVRVEVKHGRKAD